ncbi:hypothetical protein D9M68_138770 [compost metagenome]
MAETKQVWIVWTNTDLTEGRGGEFPLFVCESETTAYRMSKKQGVQGSDARVTPFEAVLHNNRWCAPVRIHQPTTEDRNTDLKREQARLADQRRHEALQRARDAGLSEEDIAILGSKP